MRDYSAFIVSFASIGMIHYLKMVSKKKIETFKRFIKHLCFSLFGTGTDALVLYVCSHYIFYGYVGEVVISPIISFECGNVVNFLVASHFVWGDRMKGKAFSAYLKRFIGFNLSYSTVFLIKTGLLLLITRFVNWDVVICNIIAMMFAGIINFIMNDNVIFKNRKESLFDSIFNLFLKINARIFLHPVPVFLDKSMKSGKLVEPCIIIANHTSHLDGTVLNTALGKTRVRTLAAKDRFEQKGFGFFLRHTRCIPIDRQHADTIWIHESLKALKSGDSVAIYPEGKHGSYRQMLPFHPGVMLLAHIAKVPLVLAYLDGPFKFFKSSHLILSEPQHIDVSNSIASPEEIQKTTNDIYLKMNELMGTFISIEK